MADNCTCADICLSILESTKTSTSSLKEIIQLVATIVNVLLTMAAPYLIKTRPVQRLIFPERTEHKQDIKIKLNAAISAIEEAARSLSQKSDSERSLPKIDTLSTK